MKKVLIFTAAYGEGHNTAARNLKAGIEHVGGDDVSVEIIDVFGIAHPKFNHFMRRLYLSAINRTPKIWSAFYQMLDERPAAQRNMWIFSKCIRAMERILVEKKPDVICSTYPLYAHFLQKIRFTDGRKPKLATIVTDSITVNSLWFLAPSDHLIVPNEDTAQVIENRGVPREKIEVLGFPVQLDFADEVKRISVAEPNEKNPPSVLYIINSGKQNAPQIVSELLKNRRLRLSVAVGRDEKLRAVIEKLFRGEETRTSIIGWTTDMPSLMMSHHIVISKAGGATVQETLAAQTPLIVNQVVPGQEEGNYFLLNRNECGVLAETPADVPVLVEKALEENAALWTKWKSNLKKLYRPDSSIQIARFILG